MAAIATALGQVRQSVQCVANDLLADGALRGKDNPHDKRADLLEFTTRGLNALREIQREQERWASASGARRRGALSSAFQHLTKALEARKEEER